MISKTSPIFKLPYQINRESFLSLLSEKKILELMNETGTISLCHREGAEDPWFDGVTKMALNSNEDIPFSEADFKKVNPGLESSYFAECHSQFNEIFMGRLGRVRLFRRSSQTTSSLHKDLDVRLHIALETNKCSFLVFPERGVFHIPADGYIYIVDTTIPHFAVNTDPALDRLHIVCSSYCGFLESRKDEEKIILSNQDLFKKIVSKHEAVELKAISQ